MLSTLDSEEALHMSVMHSLSFLQVVSAVLQAKKLPLAS